jgi:hypothetical protein
VNGILIAIILVDCLRWRRLKTSWWLRWLEMKKESRMWIGVGRWGCSDRGKRCWKRVKESLSK